MPSMLGSSKRFLASERVGRSDVYRPLVTREQMARRSIRDVLNRFFAGSATAMISHLLDANDLSEDEMQAIRREVDQRLGEEDAPGSRS